MVHVPLKLTISASKFINVDAEKGSRTKSSAAHLQLPNIGPASSATMHTLGVTRRVMLKNNKP